MEPVTLPSDVDATIADHNVSPTSWSRQRGLVERAAKRLKERQEGRKGAEREGARAG